MPLSGFISASPSIRLENRPIKALINFCCFFIYPTMFFFCFIRLFAFPSYISFQEWKIYRNEKKALNFQSTAGEIIDIIWFLKLGQKAVKTFRWNFGGLMEQSKEQIVFYHLFCTYLTIPLPITKEWQIFVDEKCRTKKWKWEEMMKTFLFCWYFI